MFEILAIQSNQTQKVQKKQSAPATKTTGTTTVPVGQKQTATQANNLIIPKFSDEIQGTIININEKLGLNYNLKLTKDSTSMLIKSQNNLIDLIKYYEGDPNYYYEGFTAIYSDSFGKKTTGFGHYYPKKNIKTQEDAYKTLADDLIRVHDELSKNIGKEKFKKLPLSIREGLIDLAFNKGTNKVIENKTLMDEIKAEDYSKIIANLGYFTSGSNSADKTKQEAGLYRRSLSRAILAARDLTGDELKEAKKEIDKLYNEAKNFYNTSNIKTTDLDNVYKCFKNEPITSKTKYADNYKIVVQKGDGLYSLTKKVYELQNDTTVSLEDYRKAFYKINKITEDNANLIKEGEELIAPAIKNVGAILGQSTEKADTQPIQEVVKPDTSKKVAADTTVKTVEETSKKDNPVTEETEPEPKKKHSFWKGLAATVGGAAIGLLAARFICKSKPVKFALVGAAIGLGISIGKLIYNKRKQKKTEPEVVTETKTGFQKMLANPNVKINTKGDFEILTLNYEIQKGNNLYSLSREYAVKQNILCNNNNIINPDLINEGNILKIHKLGYRIKKDENLDSIAERFGLAREVLEEINGLTAESKIKENQMLEIPGYIYIVKAGDTLSAISRQVGVSINHLKEVNNLSSDIIYPDQQIIVLFNDTDYNISPDKKTITIDETNNRVETIDLSGSDEVGNREYLKKRKINNKNAASYAELKPTGSGKLNGKTIIVNPGHGFQPSGITDNDIDIGNPSSVKDLPDEYKLNYDNGLRLIERLRKQGAKVIYIQGYEGKRSKGWDLVSQELKRSGNKADMFISIHGNSSAIPPKKDRMEIFYHRDSKDINGKNFANIIEAKFDNYANNEKYSESKECGLSVLTTTKSLNIPSVLWEIAFMNLKEGSDRLKDSTLMNSYADLMCESVIEYFDTYKK